MSLGADRKHIRESRKAENENNKKINAFCQRIDPAQAWNFPSPPPTNPLVPKGAIRLQRGRPKKIKLEEGCEATGVEQTAEVERLGKKVHVKKGEVEASNEGAKGIEVREATKGKRKADRRPQAQRRSCRKANEK